MKFLRALVLGLLLAAGSAQASSSQFCDRSHELTAAEQDRLLRFAAVLRDELAANDDGVALVSRSGLDLSRFHIRYSHAALAWRSEQGLWAARQLYYACDEHRPRIYDQGLAGFAMGTDDPELGYISIVRLPPQPLLDTPRALHLLATQYSANAYAYSVRYQNCNQWLIEMLAAGWGELPDGEDLRERAQQWLRDEHYAPEPVEISSRWWMLASYFVPLVHLDDHPDEDRAALTLHISLPGTLETFVHARFPQSQRVELCHDDRQIVIHRGWTPIADGCQPTEGDRVISLAD